MLVVGVLQRVKVFSAIAGMVGGFVVGFISGSQVGFSGRAALC